MYCILYIYIHIISYLSANPVLQEAQSVHAGFYPGFNRGGTLKKTISPNGYPLSFMLRAKQAPCPHTPSSDRQLRVRVPSNQLAQQKLQPPKSLAKAPDIELALWVFSAAFVHQPGQGGKGRPSGHPSHPPKKMNSS